MLTNENKQEGELSNYIAAEQRNIYRRLKGFTQSCEAAIYL
jgi:hypothetical protein